jgi:hypothetical protein
MMDVKTMQALEASKAFEQSGIRIFMHGIKHAAGQPIDGLPVDLLTESLMTRRALSVSGSWQPCKRACVRERSHTVCV